MGRTGRFTRKKLYIDDTIELACLIALATRQKLYSDEIIQFGFEEVIGKIVKKYTPFIERIETQGFEKGGEFSPIKYVVNAKFWLFKELGEVAISKQNYKKITNAYKIIVERQLGLGGKLNFQNRKNCRDYILFDTINDIFMNEKNGQLYLCEQIYEALYELLAENHQYLHQYAKCCLRTSHIIHEIAEKKEYIKKGGNYARIALSMVENEQNRTKNEKLLVTMHHIQYTIAQMQCELCVLNEYEDPEEVEKAVENLTRALYSPYNKDFYLKDRSVANMGISRFLNEIIEKVSVYSKHLKKKIEDLMEYTIQIKN